MVDHVIKILDQFKRKTTPSGPNIKFARAALAPAQTFVTSAHR